MGLDRKKFGKNLASERKRLELKVNEMAEACGVKPGSQYLYEKGNRLPNVEYIDKAIELGANPSVLLPSLTTATNNHSIESLIGITKQVEAELSELRIKRTTELLANADPTKQMEAS